MKLLIEFTGLWFSKRRGMFDINLLARFKEELPRDLRYEQRRKDGTPLGDERPHQFAEPVWMSRNEFEQVFGRVEYVELAVRELPELEDYFNNRAFIIWTDGYVVTLEWDEGKEYFRPVPRDPPQDGEIVFYDHFTGYRKEKE